jgi:hypothetical protein
MIKPAAIRILVVLFTLFPPSVGACRRLAELSLPKHILTQLGRASQRKRSTAVELSKIGRN